MCSHSRFVDTGNSKYGSTRCCTLTQHSNNTVTSQVSSAMYVLLFLLSFLWRLTLSEAKCGDPGQAFFNTNGMPQGLDGELYSAVLCLKERKSCTSTSLPVKARGVSSDDWQNVADFYGSDYGRWCTGKVTDFGSTFSGLNVRTLP